MKRPPFPGANCYFGNKMHLALSSTSDLSWPYAPSGSERTVGNALPPDGGSVAHQENGCNTVDEQFCSVYTLQP